MSQISENLLKIKSLEIENFRQYRKTKIDFSTDSDKIFTILRGVNGAGKTNIMNAITWCLYGNEKHLSKDDEDFPIVNSKALEECLPGNIVRMSVKLELSDQNGPKFRIQRKLALIREGNGRKLRRDKVGVIPSDSTPSVETLFQVHDLLQGGWKKTQYFDSGVKKILPEELTSYFLFDGERLEEFFEKIDDVKKGIEDVSQIIVTEQAIDHLTKFTSSIRQNVRDLKPKTKEVQTKISLKEKELKKLENDKKPLKPKLDQTKTKISEIEKFLLQSSDINVSTLQKEEIVTRNRIKTNRDELQKLEVAKTDFLIRESGGIYLLSAIDKALEKIFQKINKGLLPPKLKQGFVHELLETGTCICGNDISEGTDSREEIVKLLKTASYSKIGDLCTEIKTQLNMIKVTDGVLPILNSYGRKRKSLEASILSDIKKLEETQAKLQNIDIKLIADKEKEKVNLRETENELVEKLAIINHQINDTKKELDKFNREFDRETSLEGKHKFVNTKIKFCSDALLSLKKVKDELLNDVRDTVQKFTKKYFLKLAWKKGTFSDVSISPEYRITVHHVDGYDVLTGLSKGEKLILALSFMAALREITGFGFPIIIDTPLGRVSGEHRNNIATSLPEFLKHNQVTLLITDTEYQSPVHDEGSNQLFSSVRDTILPKVGKEYSLKYDSATQTTAVK